jgi:hypothetical protein
MAAILNNIDDISEVTSIAQDLIGGPQKPLRTFSFTRNARKLHRLDGSENHSDSTDFVGREWSRAVVQSSNTWTSSSADVLSDHDDIEDRTDYLLEYNRLALKVS